MVSVLISIFTSHKPQSSSAASVISRFVDYEMEIRKKFHRLVSELKKELVLLLTLCNVYHINYQRVNPHDRQRGERGAGDSAAKIEQP